MMLRNRNAPDVQITGALGWVSMAIAAAEIAAPRWLQRKLGIGGNTTLLRVLGLREFLSGLLILSGPFVATERQRYSRPNSS